MSPKPAAAAERPKRHTLSDAYEQATETIRLLLGRAPRDRSEGVTLSRNAKGETQISVEGVAREGESLDECAERVSEVYTSLRARYPLASGYVDAAGER